MNFRDLLEKDEDPDQHQKQASLEQHYFQKGIYPFSSGQGFKCEMQPIIYWLVLIS